MNIFQITICDLYINILLETMASYLKRIVHICLVTFVTVRQAKEVTARLLTRIHHSLLLLNGKFLHVYMGYWYRRGSEYHSPAPGEEMHVLSINKTSQLLEHREKNSRKKTYNWKCYLSAVAWTYLETVWTGASIKIDWVIVTGAIVFTWIG